MTDQKYWNNYFQSNKRSNDHYIESGFITLQAAIDEAYAEQREDSFSLDYEVSKMPTEIESLFKFEAILIPMTIFWVVYIFAMVNMVLVPMVEEKESGIKEILRIASSYSYLNMLSFFIIELLISMFIIGAVLTIFYSYGFTRHFHMLLMVILGLLFAISLLAYTFMVSVLFNSGKVF